LGHGNEVDIQRRAVVTWNLFNFVLRTTYKLWANILIQAAFGNGKIMAVCVT